MENVNPRVFERAANRPVLEREEDDTISDEIDSREIFGKELKVQKRVCIYKQWTRELEWITR